MKYVYLDNGASTRVDPIVLKAMIKYMDDVYGVASSQFSHQPGIMAKDGLEKAREIIKAGLNIKEGELIFTSGGTEANNMAIKGVAFKSEKRRKILVSGVEHYSVLHSAGSLETHGFEVITIPVDGDGVIDLEWLEKNIDDNTLLVSVQHSNHEVGTVQPIEEVVRIAKRAGAIVHTDAAYSFGWIPIDVEKLGVDLLTITGHKIHGPKGIGGLYIKRGTPIKKWMDGGYNEFDMRGGTENIPGAVGMAKAFELMTEEEVERVRSMRDYLKERLLSIEDTHLNGSEKNRHPANLNVTFDYIEGESVVLHLDMRGIGVITGSACFSRSLEPSHILMAMGKTHEHAHGSIRYSFGRFNKKEELDYVFEQTEVVVRKLREMSPIKGGK